MRLFCLLFLSCLFWPAERKYALFLIAFLALMPVMTLMTTTASAASLAASSSARILPDASGYNLPVLGDTERGTLSPYAERKLGERIMTVIRHDRDYLNDAPVQEYLNRFGNALLAARPDLRGEMQTDFSFFVVRDPELNAFSLPGGFIGVHSALILAAQSESELASVLAHEIGHVTQRHIARMLNQQKQDAWIPVASIIAAALTARTSGDVSAALMTGGSGVAAQRQLDFSRDAEREADRTGLEILNTAGFDTSGMVAFFKRMQTASRSYSDVIPPFLRSHPLTSERIADIQGRLTNLRYRQYVDSLDFYLVQARLRILQDDNTQGWDNAEASFNQQLRQQTPVQIAAGKYGLAYSALRQNRLQQAATFLKQARAAAQNIISSQARTRHSALFSSLAIEIDLARNQPLEALKEASTARTGFPFSRTLAWQYADALIAAGQQAEAIDYLRNQIQMYRSEPELPKKLAQVYAAQKKTALEHLSLAESYALTGEWMAALDQLTIAAKAPDASFYEQSIIDVKEREWRKQYQEEEEQKEKSFFSGKK